MFYVDHSPPFRARRLTWLQRLHRFLAYLVGAGALLGMVGCNALETDDRKMDAEGDVVRLDGDRCIKLVGYKRQRLVEFKCPPAEAVGP
jgi:hypothetical protein